VKTYHSPGEVVTLTAPVGGVVTGSAYKIGALVVVATGDAEAAEKFEGIAEGVIQVAKVSAQAWTEGVKVYFDHDASPAPVFTTTSGGNTLVGVAATAAANPSSTGSVRFDGVAR
jgi:predicted RecA/RadA family phage recombinase